MIAQNSCWTISSYWSLSPCCHRPAAMWLSSVGGNVNASALNAVFVKYFEPSIDFRSASDYTVDNLTGLYRYEVDQALKVMIARCRVLRLRLARSERETHMSAGILLAMLTSNVVKGRKREFWR